MATKKRVTNTDDVLSAVIENDLPQDVGLIAVEPVEESVQAEPPIVEEAPVEAPSPIAEEEIIVESVVTPKQEGYAAYYLGQDYGQNPYMSITEEFFAWQSGWAEGFDGDHKEAV